MCRNILRYSLLLFMWMPVFLYAQDVKLLNQQVEQIFKDLRGGERKVLVEESVATWTSSFLTEAEKDSIAAIFKSMQDLRVLTAELADFAQSVNAFRKYNEKENLNVWLMGLKEAMNVKDKKRTSMKGYLNSTRKVICEELLYAGASHKWYVRGKYRWSRGTPVHVDIDEAEVVCKTLKDSIFIYQTTVSWDLDNQELQGQGGKVLWKSRDSIYADLSAYRVGMELSEYKAENVLFHYDRKYPEPLAGSLQDNASKYTRNSATSGFPLFISYSTDIRIDSLFSKVSFLGGVQYAGEKLSGFGSEEKPAKLTISPNDTIFMYLYSRRFSIDSGRVLSGMSRMILPLDSGEFFHPNVNFAYTDKNRTVTVKRLSEQSQYTPFRDNYHQILFSVEQIIWAIDSNYMEMGMSNRSGLYKANVESLNFFNDNIYDNMQGIDEIHPLNGLHKTSVLLKSPVFTVGDYADVIKKPVNELRKQLVLLSYSDFLDYNETKDEITLKQRLFDYTQSRVGKKDYDNIRFDSHPKDSKVNALLDLKNFSLRIFGVDKFTISEKKDIYVEPSDKCVVMLRNRDMEFNGKLKAGMFDMYGNKLFFSYDKYTIDLTHVDSSGMYLADKMSGKRGAKVRSLIRDISGDIVIDKPNNKSGVKSNPGFPTFNSMKDSYVYFDDPEIRNGAYKRDSFYFVIRPYKLSEINDAGRFRYAFNGTLVSDIVPDITDTLVLMQDNSLGMNYTAPEKGLAFYGEGNLKGKISLDQRGFVADGKVELNGSDFNSRTVAMMPDSMLAETPLLHVGAIADARPDAKGEDVSVRFLRKDANLQVKSNVKPFQVYGDRVKHEGTLYVYQERMDASGKLSVKDARLISGLFKLESQNILSDKTDLQLGSLTNKNIQLNTADVKANIDLTENKGRFMNNKDANKAEFPSNRYQCSFKSFTWYMDEAYLNIGIEEEQELRRIWQIEAENLIPDQGKNVFVSTDKLCDSLTFIAPLAKYNLKSGDIQCSWVNHIDLANGRFYPDEGRIFISSLGNIQEFTGATLLCERTDSSRVLKQVTLKLKGRYSFNGSGDFDYVNQDGKKHVIRFTEIQADTVRNIYAGVNMKPEEQFYLNSGFTYKGKIVLFSKQRNLFFNGYTGLLADSTYLRHHWLKVNTYFDAGNIEIPVMAENRNDKGQRIFNAIFLNVDKTVKPYGAFQSNRSFYNDEMLIGGKGTLVWSGKEKKYIIRDTLSDAYYNMCYIPGQNTVSASGRLDMELRIPGIRQMASGNIRYDFKEEELNLDHILYTMDFEVLGKMQNVLLHDFADKKKKNITVQPELIAKLSGIYGRGLLPLAVKQLERNSNNIPDSLGGLFVLDSLSFRWDAQKRSYVSDGAAMLVSVLKKPVEKEMQVKMELIRRRSGDQIFMYIYNDQMWYYFEYMDKSLYTLSSNAEYNSIVQNEKAEKKVILNKEKQTLYTITLCPDSKKERFLKRMTAN